MTRRPRLAAIASAALLSLSCGSDEERDETIHPEKPTLYELNLQRPWPEQGQAFLGQHEPALHDALSKLHLLAQQPLAKGLLVRLGPLGGHAGDLDDWAQAFEAFRKTKRPVHCHFEQLDNFGYALASHCDEVSMTPSGSLNLVGLATQVIHGADLLELVGLKADLLQVGKYKGAADPFTRSTLSEELRQSLTTLLDDLDAVLHEHLSVRGMDAARAQEVLALGPFTGESAKREDLVDEVLFDDAARARARERAGAESVVDLFPDAAPAPPSLRELLALLTGDDASKAPEEAHVGLALLLGDIVDGSAAAGRSAADPFIRTMRRWADDPQKRAVVLRIESPGGSALASDRMWHAVRRVAKRKPVIVSLGDMAASGGYYVASAGTRIVAAPGSIVGSIGVVGGKVVVGDLARRAGLHVDTLARGPHAAWMSPFEAFTAPQRDRLEAMLQSVYQRFLKRVASGRGMPVESILPAAEGRIMGGSRAKELGLVDELGGLTQSLKLARSEAKLPKDAPVEVWPGPTDPIEALSDLSGVHATSSSVDRLLREAEQLWGPITASALLRSLTGQGASVATALPFWLQVR